MVVPCFLALAATRLTQDCDAVLSVQTKICGLSGIVSPQKNRLGILAGLESNDAGDQLDQRINKLEAIGVHVDELIGVELAASRAGFRQTSSH